MMSVQWLIIIVWLDGLCLCCLLMMEGSFCCICFHMQIVENVLQTSCILSPFAMSIILDGY